MQAVKNNNFKMSHFSGRNFCPEFWIATLTTKNAD